jgi:hypothetical protein
MSDFATEEFKQLHSELHSHVQETLNLEKYTVVGLAAYYAWVLTHPHAGKAFIWWIPVLLPLVAGLRSLALYKHIGVIAKYLRIQEVPLHGGKTGWEAFYLKHRFPWRGLIAVFIWVSIFVLTIGLAIYFNCHPVTVPPNSTSG